VCRPVFLLVAAVGVARADMAACKCDPEQPETLAARECSLTREALQQPAGSPVFFLKDINPRKPNRTLAIPRAVRKGMYRLADMSAEERLQLWSAAIQKARELWGEDWALAKNGDLVRTQCQPHVHIGKFIREVETDNFIVVNGPEEIPVPDGEGLWVHPVNGKLHVHTGEQLTESVLLR
jgi:diadenosine tetraphosphate (Ap4A) HIT family hydrolase